MAFLCGSTLVKVSLLQAGTVVIWPQIFQSDVKPKQTNKQTIKNGKKRYEYIDVGYKSTYFVEDHSEAKNKYTEDDIVRMLEFLIDNIFVECGGVSFQQVIGIPMGTNCAPLLADLFLYSYKAEFIQTLIKSGTRHLAKSFRFTYRYIDDVLSINNPKFGDCIDYIYPKELEIKDTTDADHQACYLDLDLSYNRDKRLQVKLYDKGMISLSWGVIYHNLQLMVCMFHSLYATLVSLLVVIFW